MGRHDGLIIVDGFEFKIRPYEIVDLDGVLGVWERASKIAHPFLSEAFLVAERKAIADVYMPNTTSHVAVADGAVIGFVSMMGNELGAVFVDPAYQGKGAGRALVARGGKDCDAVEVEVFEKNRIGRPFYERYGFVEIRRSVHETTGEMLIRMRWQRPA